jgi:basic membrane lipoprotein Med (substrate-binding protein (PBP1-ABC) superfamily)
MMRRFVRLSLIAAALAVSACTGEQRDAQGEASVGIRAALLTAGPVSDAGWYAGAYEGLMLLRDSLGAQVSHQQTRTPAEFDEAFLSYASTGYDLIFAHGFEYQDAAMRAGEQFPNTTFIVSGGGRYAKNVVPLIFQLEEASYLAGMVAAGISSLRRLAPLPERCQIVVKMNGMLATMGQGGHEGGGYSMTGGVLPPAVKRGHSACPASGSC